ncbi:MAG: membrane protein insertase YidC, partial [Paracoccaceae bacterium]
MDDQNKNLILATALSFLVILVWFVGGPILFPNAFPDDPVVTDPIGATAPADNAQFPGATDAPAADAPARQDGQSATPSAPETTLADTPRIPIDTPRLSGSISLIGGRIDDLSLKDYRETLDPDSANVILLNPVGQFEAYYSLFGWAPGGELDFADVPGSDTGWQKFHWTPMQMNTLVTYLANN